jgi:hypothetical protein
MKQPNGNKKPSKEDYKEKYDSLREHVKGVLRRHPLARANRTLCWYILCLERDLDVQMTIEAVKKAPQASSVNRAMREIQNENGEYRAPTDVEKERQKKQQAMKETFGQDRSKR